MTTCECLWDSVKKVLKPAEKEIYIPILHNQKLDGSYLSHYSRHFKNLNKFFSIILFYNILKNFTTVCPLPIRRLCENSINDERGICGLSCLTSEFILELDLFLFLISSFSLYSIIINLII